MSVRVFVSYSHVDEDVARELLDYMNGLVTEGIEFWHDRSIAAGDRWDDEIRQQIGAAQVALILVSQAFLDSAYCRNVEIPTFLDQQERDGLALIPVLLSACEWGRHPWLAHRQFIPTTGTVEEDCPTPGARKRIFHDIRQQVRAHVDRMRTRRAAPLVNWRRVAVALPLVVLIVAAGDLLRRTSAGTIELAWDNLTHRVLAAAAYDRTTRVVVLDLSAFAGGPQTVTSRASLRRALEGLATMGPLGIGIDVNFTPRGPGVYQDVVNDPAFFGFCRALAATSGIPIHLGVFGTELLSPAHWLGDADYKSLAASLAIPRSDAWRLPRAVWNPTTGDTCQSMSYALGRDYLRSRRPPPPWLASVFITHRQVSELPEFSREEFNIDRSVVAALQRTSLPLPPDGIITGSAWDARVRGRLVLLGDAQPGAFGALPADVFVHAAGAETLANGPLLEPRLLARLGAALLVSAVLLAIDDVMRGLRDRRGAGRVAARRSTIAAAWIVALFWIASVVLTAMFRITWFDVPLLAVGLAAILLWRQAKARRHVVAAAAVVLAATAASGQTPPQPVGWVTPINGTTFLSRSGSNNEVALRPRVSARTAVYPGDRVRCEPNGALTLNLDGKDFQPDCSSWYPIPIGVSGDKALLRAAIQEYARLGGVTRGSDAVLTWPIANSRVRPGRFMLRWLPLDGVIALRVAQASTGTALWEQAGIDGRRGEFVSQDARAVLQTYRANHDDLRLRIVLTARNGIKAGDFELLSEADEARVAAALDEWQHYDDGVLRSIGRAFTYSQFRLHQESAESYGDALALEPDSVPMLEKAIEAYTRAGDDDRARKLRAHLRVVHPQRSGRRARASPDSEKPAQ